MRSLGIFSAALTSLAFCAGPGFTEKTLPQVENPRPFGYAVGDVLERRITLLAPLSKAELPQPGRIDDWLELRRTEISGRDVILTYQLMNAPVEVKTLELPAITLDTGDTNVIVPEWPFTVAPITPAFVLAREGLSEMRSDSPPRTIPTGGVELRLTLYILALAAMLLFWTYPKFAWRIADRPFSRAYRNLRSLKGSDAGVYRRALTIVHRAFDETAGSALFRRELPQFLSAHPSFQAAAADVRKFFSLSEQEFFSANPSERQLDWIVSFCRSLSVLEAR